MYWTWRVMARNISSSKTILATVSLVFTFQFILRSADFQLPLQGSLFRSCRGETSPFFIKNPGKLRGPFYHLPHRFSHQRWEYTARWRWPVSLLFCDSFHHLAVQDKWKKEKDCHRIGKRFFSFFPGLWNIQLNCQNVLVLGFGVSSPVILTIAEGINTLKLNNVRTQQFTSRNVSTCFELELTSSSSLTLILKEASVL